MPLGSLPCHTRHYPEAMPGTKPSSAVELLVPLDRSGPRSLHHQLEHYLREGIRSGRLTAGATMPSSRALSHQLAVARGVVVEAYEQLVAEGYLLSRPGGSTRVADVPTLPIPEPAVLTSAPDLLDLRPGRPDVTAFPREVWARSARRVLNASPADRFGYLDGMGVPELRAALAEYLGRARGTAIRADDIVISTGFMQALHLVARALVGSGAARVAVEEPYDPAYRAALTASGLHVLPITVDGDGIDVESLRASGADAVVVTPAHQFPTGAVLSPERRIALLEWARERDTLVVEDDYDAEFRYDREPVGAMQGLDPEHVIYAGTASKSIAPGLRLGWLGAPPRFVVPLVEAKYALDHGSGALDQLILADVIERGELDRHLRRVRSVYRRRRDTLLTALARHLPRWTTVGASAGLHVLAYPPANVDVPRLVHLAESEAGIRITALDGYRAIPTEPNGVVFGYGTAEERHIDGAIAAVARLAATWPA
jgi:GntR family transcriptional regulator/MocR family aminotransferase